MPKASFQQLLCTDSLQVVAVLRAHSLCDLSPMVVKVVDLEVELLMLEMKVEVSEVVQLPFLSRLISF